MGAKRVLIYACLSILCLTVVLFLEVGLGLYLYKTIKKDFEEIFVKELRKGVCKEEFKRVLEDGNYLNKYIRETINVTKSDFCKQCDQLKLTRTRRHAGLYDHGRWGYNYGSWGHHHHHDDGGWHDNDQQTEPPGQPGPVGPPGPPGERGLQGQKGEQGVWGPPGPNGAQGLQGQVGQKGETGDRGSKGENGATGLAGAPGLPGNEGPAGKDGRDGDSGTPGQKGEMGVVGLPGERGVDGLPGKIGNSGIPGIPGLPGPAGSPGKEGVQGPKGDKGEKGERETPTIQIVQRISGCEQLSIGKLDFVQTLNETWTTIMIDSNPLTEGDAHKFWGTMNNIPKLFEFNNLESLTKNDPSVIYDLKIPFEGNSHVVSQGSFFYNSKDRTEEIIKYDLMVQKTESLIVPGISNTGKKLYTSGYSKFDVSVDEYGLWIIFPNPNSDNTLISKINAEDMTISRTWDVSLKGEEFIDMFIASGILYTMHNTRSYQVEINFAINLFTGTVKKVNLLGLRNTREITMVTYDHRGQRILLVERGKMQAYSSLCDDDTLSTKLIYPE